MSGKTEQEKKVQALLKQKYNEQKQSLNLYKCPQWSSILHPLPQLHQKIKILILTKNQLTDNDLALILKSQWPDLVQLWLNDNKITRDGAKLIHGGKWDRLEDLSLHDNKIGWEGACDIFSTNFTKLTILNIGLNEITQAMLPFAITPIALPIKHINLSGNRLGPRGISLVSKVNMEGMTKANLSNCNLGDQGARHLTKCKWPGLTELELGYNKIGLDGLIEFVTGNWKNLNTKLNLYYNILPAMGVVHLIRLDARALPEQKICLWGLGNPDMEKTVKAMVELKRSNPEKQRNRYGYGEDFDE